MESKSVAFVTKIQKLVVFANKFNFVTDLKCGTEAAALREQSSMS